MAETIPTIRQHLLCDLPVDQSGAFVLYWMHSCHRLQWSFALDHALALARTLGKPLLILETIGLGDRWDSLRHHTFALTALQENQARFSRKRQGPPGIAYFPWIERSPGEMPDLLEHLSRQAAVIVTDDEPSPLQSSISQGLARLARSCPVRADLIDGAGILPWRAASKVYLSAYDFRRFLQKNLARHLTEAPHPNPLEEPLLHDLPAFPHRLAHLKKLFPGDTHRFIEDETREGALQELPIDHGVPPSPVRGGPAAAQDVWHTFLRDKLTAYPEARSHPDDDGSSGLSPYLRHGQISVHQLFSDLTARESWTTDRLGTVCRGHKSGWWGMSPAVEAFLDELITWRELGRNFSFHRDDVDRYDSLPAWAQMTLERHRNDKRPSSYHLEAFAAGGTHDHLWNAAQQQLRTEGRLHNYLRMLWGKKILEWSSRPEEALHVMVELNNRYALDGRDPNSYAGIFWVLGRYDRPWGPERPVFGTIRYMSSDNTAKKLRVRAYLRTYSAESAAHAANAN